MRHKNNTLTLPVAEASYDVGYGRPPQHSRFSSGRSGNPRGRPKGSQNLTTLLDEALDQKVTVTEHGQSRQITKREAIATQVVNRAVKGNPCTLKLVLGWEDKREATLRAARGADQGESQATTPSTQRSASLPILTRCRRRISRL
jgi:hypothetical protein